MCLIAFHWSPGSAQPLLLLANRDEFYARPSAPTRFWEQAPQVLAGRDLAAGGTWLGVTRQGRFAALTNYRDPRQPPGARSRGQLVADFLTGTQRPADYAAQVAADHGGYGGFNLLVGDAESLWYLGNRGDEGCRPVAPGLHGLSNALLDTPWPKVERLTAALADLGPARPLTDYLPLLQDPAQAEDHALPDTGVGLDWERVLSAVHIDLPTYGTRTSTVLRLGADHVEWREQNRDHGPAYYRFPRVIG